MKSDRHERAKEALTRALAAMVHPVDHSVALGYAIIAVVHLSASDETVRRLDRAVKGLAA